jgi:hypothetical protein
MSTTTNQRRSYNGTERPPYTPDAITTLMPDEVFVFGSNLQGHHGGGAARVAQMKFGAIWGQGVGLQGQCYAIPTMQGGVETIKPYVDEFIAFAKEHKELFFYVTRIGCGIAGFKDQDIAPLFVDALTVENVCLPESFEKIIEQLTAKSEPFPGITRTTSIRLYQQGQVRTLADIAMTLNDQHHYADIESFMRDFDDVIKSYRERGTVSFEICKMVEALIRNNEATLFTNSGYLDFDRLIEMVDHLAASDENNPLEIIYSRREKTKMLRLAALLNDMMHYTAASDLMNDLSSIAYGRFNCGDNRFMNDPFRYPLAFFKQGVELLWEEIQDNGTMSNELLEKKMFTEHEERVEEFGLEYVIRNDYYNDGPCHPEVYLPKRIGTAPVYLLDENFVDHCSGKPMFVKSCGEGKGPNAHHTLYEMELVGGILRRECRKGNYEEIGEYYIPVGDDSKPIFKQGHGKMEFDILADKKRFLQKIRKNTGQC